MKGPVVTAAAIALEAGDPTLVLQWVQPADEAAIRSAFQQALAVCALGSEARALPDRYFFETVVRIPRAGEGAPYTGSQTASRAGHRCDGSRSQTRHDRRARWLACRQSAHRSGAPFCGSSRVECISTRGRRGRAGVRGGLRASDPLGRRRLHCGRGDERALCADRRAWAPIAQAPTTLRGRVS